MRIRSADFVGNSLGLQLDDVRPGDALFLSEEGGGLRVAVGTTAAQAMVHLGTAFAIGQRVGFVKVIGDRHWHCEGEVVAVTQYRDREPCYQVRPNDASVAFLKRDWDVQCDEGEVHGFDLAAEDPDAGRQAEPRMKAEAPVEQSYEGWLIEQRDSLVKMHALLTEPASLTDKSVMEFGYAPLGQLRQCIGEHLRATISAIEEKLRAVQSD